MKKYWCVYLLRCGDESLYCGITVDAATRWAAHISGKGARYTRMRGAVALRVVACCLTRSEAAQWEHRIKKLPKNQKEDLWANSVTMLF